MGPPVSAAHYYRAFQPHRFEHEYRDLPRPELNALMLALMLQIGPFTSPIPGVTIGIGRLGLSEKLRCDPGALDAALEDLSRRSLVHVEWSCELILLPVVLADAPAPNSLTAAITWHRAFRSIPPCALKSNIDRLVRAKIAQWKPEHRAALTRAWIRGQIGKDQRGGRHRTATKELAANQPKAGPNTEPDKQPRNQTKNVQDQGSGIRDQGSGISTDLSLSAPDGAARSSAQEASNAAVGQFLSHFCDQFKLHRSGATYKPVPKRHVPAIKRLLAHWPVERLRQLASFLLSLEEGEDAFIDGSDRGIEVLETKASWLDERLARSSTRTAPLVDWFEECRTVHAGACGLDRYKHALQMSMGRAHV